MIHKLIHLLGWQKGNPFAFYDGDKLMMSFRCGTCGDMSGVHQIDDTVDAMLKYKPL